MANVPYAAAAVVPNPMYAAAGNATPATIGCACIEIFGIIL